ncbi:MAG: hypothetical protein GQ569_09875 [Methylococcaceae bacterium]|nr:hypothetical protein [Methylococcaceae bacterium]
MNNTEANDETDMLAEYDFDYSQAKKNRFATKNEKITVTLDVDIGKIFTNSEAVNKALRAILTAMPQTHQNENI